MRSIPAPGVYWGSYPERSQPRSGTGWQWGNGRYHKLLASAKSNLPACRALTATGFVHHVEELRAHLAKEGLTDQLAAKSLATVSEAIRRTSGLEVFDTQLFAAAIILDNKLAEMATGEGKTLVALLTAATGALAGIPVHVLTANDYLVSRDAARLSPIYALLGLSVGTVTQGMEDTERRIAYASAITYVTAKELVFDYLRDSLRLGSRRSDLARRAHALDEASEAPVLRGLCMAVLDEADSLLIDEAQMPLVLSRLDDDPATRSFHWQALALADQLREGEDFTRESSGVPPQLTEQGRERLTELIAPLGGRWRSKSMREETIGIALAARHFYQKDRHYLVRDGKIEIIDEITGRTAVGRVWSRGLHTLVEIKEGCKPTPATRTLAQITYQRFFPRYLRLGGLSGTLTEARSELREIYSLAVVKVALRTPSARQTFPPRIFPDQTSLWAAATIRISAIQHSGRPVLIGTSSVADSEALSQQLRLAGIEHQVLNARFDEQEAHIVARAGQAGQVTVTTNIAGRGTDIELGPGVAAAGGLHVLSCQHNTSRRIDRQLQGRCARQGDPGSTEVWIAHPELPHAILAWLGKIGSNRKNEAWSLTDYMVSLWLAWLQKKYANRERHARRLMLQADRAWIQGLSFRGMGE